MRVSLWTDDINDPSEITSYFAYFPNIESLHSGWQDKGVDELFVKSQQEMDKEKRADMYKTIQKTYVRVRPDHVPL